uniref:Uncharacterized protein n=1 Tax=Rhizophora mucronata TaxID=61149 RepID=A0A2P2PCB7_RHIMU
MRAPQFLSNIKIKNNLTRRRVLGRELGQRSYNHFPLFHLITSNILFLRIS